MFHIAKRIGSKDRMVIIYEIDDDGENGVCWAATESPLFEHTPSCFTLMINNFPFLNASYDFLFSESFGFPFPSERFYREGGRFHIQMTEGTGHMQFPLVNRDFKRGGTQLFQPMIPYSHFQSEDGEPFDFSGLYDVPYVRSHCMDFTTGRGLIYRRDRNNLVAYPKTPSRDWLPKQKFPRGEVHHQTVVQAGEFLEELFRFAPSFDSLPEDERQAREREMESAVRLHRTIMDHLINQREMHY